MGNTPLRHASLKTTRKTRALYPVMQRKVGTRDSLYVDMNQRLLVERGSQFDAKIKSLLIYY